MNKNYLQPSVTVEGAMIELARLICASNGVTSGSKGIRYGGVDTDGNKVANGRSMNWDDDED